MSATISANPLVVDGAIAGGLTALALLAVAAGSPDMGQEGPLNIGLLLLQTLPLILRRRFPVAVLAIIVAALVAQLLLLPAGGSLRAVIGLLIAVFTVGEQLERRLSLLLTLVVVATVAALQLELVGMPAALQQVIQTSLTLLAAWFVGGSFRTRRLYARSLEERTLLLQREGEGLDRRAVLEERERISRDLHDAVTHHVSVIVIQAGGALRALDRRPAEARRALEAIDATGRQALTDMRRMLGILGEGGTPEPVPGLDQLGDLLEKVRASGLPVELSVEGRPRDLDPGMELAAYRIIQECLTNALKHAAGGRARVAVRYEAALLEVAVDTDHGADAARALEPPHDGRGLLGMRERVAMFRGTLEAGRTAQGFRVSARLPLEDVVPVG